MISQSPRLRLFRALSLRSQSPARAVGAEESGGVGGALNRAGGQGCPGSHPTPHFWCDQPELAVRATKEPRVASCLPSSLQTWPPAGTRPLTASWERESGEAWSLGDRGGARTSVPGRQWTGRRGSRTPGARARESRARPVGAEGPARACPCWGCRGLRGGLRLPVSGATQQAFPLWGGCRGTTRERPCAITAQQPHGVPEQLMCGLRNQGSEF